MERLDRRSKFEFGVEQSMGFSGSVVLGEAVTIGAFGLRPVVREIFGSGSGVGSRSKEGCTASSMVGVASLFERPTVFVKKSDMVRFLFGVVFDVEMAIVEVGVLSMTFLVRPRFLGVINTGSRCVFVVYSLSIIISETAGGFTAGSVAGC